MEVARLVELEEESWASSAARELYATPLIPGFPWYTLRSESTSVARRHVLPYHYTFRVFVKGRWAGRDLLDVYSEEHAHHSRAYYEACMQQGRLRRQPCAHHNVRRSQMKRSHGVDVPDVSEVVTDTAESKLLQQGDLVLHTIHRHEVPIKMGTTGVDPILLAAVRIREYGLLIVHKPAGVPTHAGGRYSMNSCTSMLEYVLAPKRLKAWLIQRDPLLQSIVSTTPLREREIQELLSYYSVREEENEGEAAGIGIGIRESVPFERLPRPCYRLDKVTSGVLLFGVSQSATRRVGEALTNKTRQMETLFLQQLWLPLRQQTSKTLKKDESNVPTLDEKILESLYVGVRKRYLARVHGRFPNRAVQLLHSRSLPKKCEKSKEKKYIPNDGLFLATNGSAYCEKEVAAPVSQAGPTMLLASPLVQYRFRDDEEENSNITTTTNNNNNNNNKNENNEPHSPQDGSRKLLREPFLIEAATLCQPLCYYNTSSSLSPSSSSCVLWDECETLVHCVPFTGRMHQIRMHLSDWGHPIIGDVSYYTGTEQQEQEDGEQKETIEITSECKKTTVYFHVEELPKIYRETFYTHDDLCWECLGRIPVASFSDGVRGVVALHAWKYEMDHHLLLVDGNSASVHHYMEGREEGKNDDERQGEIESISDRENPPELCCSWEAVHEEGSGFVQRKGSTVIFSAPPPTWSLS